MKRLQCLRPPSPFQSRTFSAKTPIIIPNKEAILPKNDILLKKILEQGEESNRLNKPSFSPQNSNICAIWSSIKMASIIKSIEQNFETDFFASSHFLSSITSY